MTNLHIEATETGREGQARGPALDPGLLRRALELAGDALPGVEASRLAASVEDGAGGRVPDLQALAGAVRAQGQVTARLRTLGIEALRRYAAAGLAALVPTREGVLLLTRRGAWLLSAAGEQRVRLSRRALRQHCGQDTPTLLLLEPSLHLEPLSQRHTGDNSPWRRLGALLAIESGDLATLVVYAAALGALSLAVPVAVQVLVNTITFGALLQPLIVLTLLLLGVLTLTGLLQVMQSYAVELLQRRLFVRLSEDFARRLLAVPTEERARRDLRELSNRFFEISGLQKAASSLLLDGLGLALQTLVGLSLLGFYHPMLLALDVGLVIALLAVVALGRGAVRTARKESAAKYRMAAMLQELAARPGQAVQAEADEAVMRADGLVRDYLGARRAHFRHLLRQIIGGVGVQIGAMAALLGVGGWLVMRGELTLGQLVAAEIVVGAVGAGFAKLGKQVEAGYDLLASLDKVGQVLDLPLAVLPEPEARDANAAPPEPPTSALAASGRAERVRRVSRLLVAAGVAGALGMWLVPWQQSVKGKGRVIAYAPLERQQAIEAPVPGRVVHWHVQEGDRVKAGEPIADIADNDPEILQRLERERDAARAQLAAADMSITTTEAQIASLSAARESAAGAAALHVQMARDRHAAARRAVDAAEAALRTAELNLKRQEGLHAEGLASTRTLELASLEAQTAHTQLDRAGASLSAASAEVKALEAERARIDKSNQASIESTRSAIEKLRADRAKFDAQLARVEVRLARQRQMQVVAPRDGTILRLIAKQGTEMVKAGDPLVMLVPEAGARAVELYVSGNDAPLIDPGREVRLQFEGWPAVQFMGWPSVAVGTFPAKVAFVDSHDDGQGRFRVVVVPNEELHWPEQRYLRQGVRAGGWVLLNQVSLGFELWRQFNGFPPAVGADAPALAEDDAAVASAKEG